MEDRVAIQGVVGALGMAGIQQAMQQGVLGELANYANN